MSQGTGDEMILFSPVTKPLIIIPGKIDPKSACKGQKKEKYRCSIEDGPVGNEEYIFFKREYHQ
jgi:hypothetical protein